MKSPHSLPVVLALVPSLLFAACGGSPATAVAPDLVPGEDTVVDGEGITFFADPHFSGRQPVLTIEEIVWGRPVDVYDEEPNTGERTLRHRNFLIAPEFASDAEATLGSNPLTQRAFVVVHAARGTDRYDATLARLTEDLVQVPVRSGSPDELAHAPMVPRNAALSVRFSDLLDASTIGADTVRVVAGTPLSVRVLPDTNHGGVVQDEDGAAFYTTRVLIDPTVSKSELVEDQSDLAPNGAGFPEAQDPLRCNVAIRFPTVADPASGQFDVLTNLIGRPLDEARNAPLDESLATRPVLRAFRSGGRTSSTGDPHNGFLPDDEQPRLLGSQGFLLRAADAHGGAGEHTVELEFDQTACALAPRAGDLLELQDLFAEVVADDARLDGARAFDVRVRVLSGDDLGSYVGLRGLHVTPFDPSAGHDPACFVTLRPQAAEFPLTKVDPDLQVTLRFSEPMDVVGLNGLEGLVVTRTAGTPGPEDIVVARVMAAPDLHKYTWQPVLSLSHEAGRAETYHLRTGLTEPLRDLAGNRLSHGLPMLAFSLDPEAPTDRNGGFVLRFDELDETGDGFAEVRGQYLHQEGRIVPRPVSRFSFLANRSQGLVDNMQRLPHPVFASPHDNGVTEPLNPLGSRVMTAWRTADLGLGLQNESLFNIDVEGLSWAPRFGSVLADNLTDFSITLGHSVRLPDDGVDPTGGIWAPDSGLVADSFSANVLDEAPAAERVVHERHEGYVVHPADSFTTPDGDLMVPFPLNRGKDPDERRYYTWRDTALQRVGGADGVGAPIGALFNAGEIEEDAVGTVAPPSYVPSVALPLLIDFKNWPGSGTGHNFLDVMLAGSPTTFGFELPANFRVHSTGGVDTLGQVAKVLPDSGDKPLGGYNTVPAIAPVGTASSAADSLFYVGQLDVVVRVSRAHTIWIDAGSSARWLAPRTVPHSDQQPAGTSIEFAHRRAELVSGPPLHDAFALNAYGDQPVLGTEPDTYGPTEFQNSGVSFLDPDDERWSADTGRLDGSRFVQNRLTFVSNVATGATPELRAVGFVYDLED